MEDFQNRFFSIFFLQKKSKRKAKENQKKNSAHQNQTFLAKKKKLFDIQNLSI
jgi:hypothetical protein